MNGPRTRRPSHSIDFAPARLRRFARGAFRVSTVGDRIVVEDGAGRFHPETGQGLLDLAPRAGAGAIVIPLVSPAPGRGSRDAEPWLRRAEALEDDAPREAEAAYRRALALDPGHGGAHLGLGCLLHERGELRAAEAHYRRAATSPEHRALAAYDLGVACEDQGRVEDALRAYALALEADPALADAHFNASRLLERTGRRADALRHLAAYRRLSRR